MRMLILAVLALALTPLAGWSQAPKDSWDNLKQLRPGHKVKVVDQQLKSWDGNVVSVLDEAITIRAKSNQQEITIERANVLRVTDLMRSSRLRNALIGFAAGAILYAGFRRNTSDSAEHAFAIATMGAIGAGVGATIPNPRPTLYRVKQQPPTQDTHQGR